MTKVVFLCGVALFSVALSSPEHRKRPDNLLKITGDIDRETTFSGSDLAKMPHTMVNLTEKDGTQTGYSGVPLMQLLSRFHLYSGEHVSGKALATYVLVTAKDGYEVVFGLGELDAAVSGKTVILADSIGAKPLDDQLGPLRIVVGDDKKQARCIRMVTSFSIVKLRK